MQYKGYEIFFTKRGSVFIYNSRAQFIVECENEHEARKYIDILTK